LEECDHRRKLSFVDVNFTLLSISRQTELLWISRSSYYYTPIENPEKRRILDKLDEIYTSHPFLGSRRMRIFLKQEWFDIWRCRIRWLMKILWIRTIYPHKITTIPNKAHKKYPYLLNNLEITHSNQVWSTDITYIRMKRWFIYLIAVIDWFSRKVLSWRVSNTMDVSFCIEALNEALENHGTPEIFNTDQWSQFTSNSFTNILESNNIRISMDSRWRYADNIFVERLWRTIKQEEVYLREYNSPIEAIISIRKYMVFYNQKRPHQSLWYKTPHEVYIESILVRNNVTKILA